jgi:lipopolysaccharide/colanic/teichoic acid biosynthesis glycosyltransferase
MLVKPDEQRSRCNGRVFSQKGMLSKVGEPLLDLATSLPFENVGITSLISWMQYTGTRPRYCECGELMMVHEEYLDRAYSSSLGEQERDFPGPMTLVHAPTGETGTIPAHVAPLLEKLNRAAATAAQGESVRIAAWQAAARAKGQPGYFLAKRCLDIILAVLSVFIFSPVLVLAAVLIRLTSRGPALFRQERVGYGGRRFTMYKFRSMYIDNDDRLHRTAYEQFLRGERMSGKVDGDLLPEGYAPQSTSDSLPSPKRKRLWASGDPRITPLGNLLRRSSIDELPQLFNVLKGEMSLVGPRPPIPYEVGLYQTWHMGRLDTLPGMTGVWQVQGRSRVSFDQMVQMDLEYIQRQSFWYDVKLLILTIPAVLSRKGAY